MKPHRKSQHDHPFCPHSGKITYPSRKFAKLVIARAKRERGQQLYSYKCPDCRGIHVTRSAPRGLTPMEQADQLEVLTGPPNPEEIEP